MTEALEPTGLVPDSFSFHRKKLDIKALEDQLSYPFWVRSEGGSSGLGSLLIHSAAELENWITINENIQHFIASTYLPGRNLCCKLLYWKGRLLRSASGQRVNYIMSKVAPSGITGNTSFGRLLNEPDLVDQADRAMQILFQHTRATPHGFFTADFKEDEDGKPFITEINVRMVAFNHAFAQAGANFTEDISRLLTKDSTIDPAYQMYTFEPGTIFLRDVDADPIVMNEKELKKEIVLI
jgi:carbamoyl-phosphate synthase large subunit